MNDLPLDAVLPEGYERANILIVDDLPEKLLVFGTLLEHLGQNLVFANSGREALRELLKQEFAVILLDVNMPDMDGFETAELIRRYRPCAHTPIIFITAYADEMQTAQGYSLGAVDYILSPVVPEILSSKIKVFVELFLLQRRIRLQADERIALAAAEVGRRVAEDSIRRSNYLMHASRQLSESLDVDVGIRRMLGLLVPELADVAVVLVEHDTSVQLAWSRPNAEVAAFSGNARSDLPEALIDVYGQVMGSKKAQELREDDIKAMAMLLERHGGPTSMQLRDGLAVPLLAGERALGIVLVSATTPRGWSMLEELTDRAAVALENARLYAILQAEIVERRAAELKLQQANQRKDEFLAMLSHELRNPLAPIRNAVEVVRRLAPKDPKLLWANDVMDRQARHLTRLVEELLDVARISQGKITLHLDQVDLCAVIEHGVETARPFIEFRQHTLTLDLPPEQVWLRGDFARLSQIIANLLNNAAKYTEVGGQIKLSLQADDDEALIAVEDNGMGLEPELLPHVFELFEQGRRSLDRSQGGLGVGLTLVQRLVHLHHGSVDVTSGGQGQGAVFRVHLPVLRKENLLEAESSVCVSPEEQVKSRVLVVDDNADAAESVAMVLTMHGHEVRTASDGAQALACLSAFGPEAVVLDIGLPGEDGYEIARRIRRHEATRHALLIALTGYGQREDVARATEAGFDHHFVKPADPQILAHCIAQSHLKSNAIAETSAV